MRGYQLHLLLQTLGCIKDRRTTYRSSATAISATSLRGGVGITVQDQHLIYGNAEFVGDDLRKGCLFTLTVWRRSGIDHYRTRLLNAHASALIKTNRCRSFRAETADLDI